MICRFALGTLALLGFFAGFAPAHAAERPNILWVTCEDISPNIGCYGDEYAVTPNIDKLAAQGVRYTYA
ncbi:MAG TPA: sulfatase-like hydrolase/transferase, partial [Gemmataceae bacterium]